MTDKYVRRKTRIMNDKKKAIIVSLTSSQLCIAVAYARKLSDDDIDVVIVAKGRVPNVNYEKLENVKVIRIPTYNIAQQIYCKVRYYYLYKFSLLRKMMKDNTDIYLFNERDSITKRLIEDAQHRVTMIEEGIAPYFMNYDPLPQNPRVNTVDVGFPELFLKAHPHYDGEVRKYDYDGIFNKEHARFFCEICDLKFNSEEVSMPILYLGQPSLDEGENKYLSELFAAIADKKVYIKPHPRETSSKYRFLSDRYENVVVLDDEYSSVSVECLTQLFDVETIMSLNSSGGVNIAITNKNIKVIFLCEIKEFDFLKSNIIWDNEPVLKELVGTVGIHRPKTMDEFRLLL